MVQFDPCTQYSPSQFLEEGNLIGQPWIGVSPWLVQAVDAEVLGIPVFRAEQILQVQARVGKVIS